MCGVLVKWHKHKQVCPAFQERNSGAGLARKARWREKLSRRYWLPLARWMAPFYRLGNRCVRCSNSACLGKTKNPPFSSQLRQRSWVCVPEFGHPGTGGVVRKLPPCGRARSREGSESAGRSRGTEVRGPGVRQLPALGVGEGRVGGQVLYTCRAPWGHPQLLDRLSWSRLRKMPHSKALPPRERV